MSTVKTAGIILPSDPEERKKIKLAVKEISNSMTRIDAEKENIKDIVSDLSKTHELPKPAIKKIAAWYHKQDLAASVGQVEDAQGLYETVFGTDD